MTYVLTIYRHAPNKRACTTIAVMEVSRDIHSPFEPGGIVKRRPGERRINMRISIDNILFL